MVTDLVSELTSIGYELLLEGDHVKLHYMKPDDPPDSARMLIDELKVCKAEVVNILRAKSGPGSNATFKWRNPYPRGTPEARRESLLQVMTAIWETAREEVCLEDVERVSGVSRFKLYEGFKQHFGMSPLAFRKKYRLEEVRRNILRSGSRSSISGIAMDWGFTHLGRFSIEYKKQFNELPSETLKRSRQNP